MSLQIWLPFTGNLNNNGIINASVTELATVGYSSGKIGSCWSSGRIFLDSTTSSSSFSDTNITIAFWFNNNSTMTGDCAICGFSGNGYSSNLRKWDFFNYPTKNDFHWSMNDMGGGVLNGVFTDGIWHHVAITKSGTTLKIYIDAVLKYSGNSSNPGYSYNENYYIGASGTSYKLNDFRVYDNCLSESEIKDLANCLVANYQLKDDIPYTNLVKNTTYVIYNNYGVTASLTKLSETFNSCDVYRLTMTPTESSLTSFRNYLANHGVYGFWRKFSANTKYCFWIYYRPVTHTDIRVGGTASNINGWTEIAPHYYKNGWYRVGQYRNGSVTTDKTDNVFTSFYSPSAAVGTPISIDFVCPHLVEGYDYILEDTEYQQTYASYNILDCSGYKYDGSTTSSTAPVLQTSSPRSNRSLYFNSLSKNLTLNANFLPSFTTGSVSFWAKVSAIGSSGVLPFTGQTTSHYLLASSSWTGAFYNGTVTAASGATIKYYIDGIEDSTPSGADNVWHHYCVTGINLSAWTALKLNNYSSSWNSPSIYYSDIRFYNTVLSANNVKDLYNSPIKVTKSGTLITNGEVIE